jgi:hypothetical protein
MRMSRRLSTAEARTAMEPVKMPVMSLSSAKLAAVAIEARAARSLRRA